MNKSIADIKGRRPTQSGHLVLSKLSARVTAGGHIRQYRSRITVQNTHTRVQPRPIDIPLRFSLLFQFFLRFDVITRWGTSRIVHSADIRSANENTNIRVIRHQNVFFIPTIYEIPPSLSYLDNVIIAWKKVGRKKNLFRNTNRVCLPATTRYIKN